MAVLRVPPLVAGQSTALQFPGSTLFEDSDSDYLSRTPGTAGNRRTCTLSYWLKLSQPNTTYDVNVITGGGSDGNNRYHNGIDSPTYNSSFYKYERISGSDKLNASSSRSFRDYAGWYHFVEIIDTPRATPADRYRVYVNGEQISMTFSTSYTQNLETLRNNTNANTFAARYDASNDELCGNVCELIQLDGQSLGPEYFGYTDPLTNTWRPKKYTQGVFKEMDKWTCDTYNSWNSGQSALRYQGIKFLTSDGGKVGWLATGTSNTGLNVYTSTDNSTWTRKLSGVTVDSTTGVYYESSEQYVIIVNGSDANWSNEQVIISDQNGAKIHYSNGTWPGNGSPTMSWTGPAYSDGTLASYNSFYLPLDGTGYAGAFQTAGNIGQDQSGLGNDHTVNGSPTYTTTSPSGVSQSVDTSAGLTTTGYATNYVTWNPLYMHSDIWMTYGNTVANGPSAGAARPFACSFGIDSGKYYWEIESIRPGAANNGGQDIGICRVEYDCGGTTTPGNDTYSWATSGHSRDFRHNNGVIQAGYVPDTFLTGTTVMCALDMDNGKFWMGTNGVWGTTSAGLGDPANGVNPVLSSDITDVGPIFPCQRTGTDSGANSLNLNSGQTPFAYGAPKGFLPLCAANAPRRGILPKDYFGIVEYTGDGNSPRSFTGLGFAPDLIWYKETTEDRDHQLYDTVRGVGPAKNLVSNTAYAQASNDDTSYGYTSSFDRDGWTVTNGSSGGNENIYTNKSGQGYVCWGWKAGGNKNTFNIDGVGYASAAAAGLDGGGITPTGASVGTKQGFSIIGYTGTGSNSSFSHGLGTNPAFMIFKNLSASEDWCVYHVDIQTGSTRWTEGNYALLLNKKDHYAYGTTFFANTFPTTSLVKVGTSGLVNTSSQNYIAYIWTDVPGLQRIGKYIGRGGDNYVYLGFKPKLVMCKRYVANSSPDTSTDYTSWSIYDTTRNTYNGETPNQLWANCYAPEGKRGNCSATSSLGDMRIEAHATGFYMDGPGSSVNADTGGYIYAAWADQPEGNIYGAQSLAR